MKVSLFLFVAVAASAVATVLVARKVSDDAFVNKLDFKFLGKLIDFWCVIILCFLCRADEAFEREG